MNQEEAKIYGIQGDCYRHGADDPADFYGFLELFQKSARKIACPPDLE